MPDLLGVTNPVPGHENANINRNMPVIPNDPRLQNAADPTRVTRGDNRTERQDSGGVAKPEQLVGAMLIGGEFDDYVTEVFRINGFKNENELVDEAKN